MTEEEADLTMDTEKEHKDSTKSLNPPSVPLAYRQNSIDQEGGGDGEKLGGMKEALDVEGTWCSLT